MSKPKPDESEANHPFIGSLVHRMDIIGGLIVTEKYDPALRGMMQVFYSLKPEHQNSEKGKGLLDYMKKARNSRDRVHDLDPVVLRGRQFRFDWDFRHGYEQVFQELSQLIWDGGYYSFDLYRKAIPAAGPNVSGSKPKKAIPSTLSSRVKKK